MYRVATFAGLAVLLSACSLSMPSMPFSQSASETSGATTSSAKRAPSVALGGEPRLQRDQAIVSSTQVAKLDDKTSPGAPGQAVRGNAEGRDFSAARLDVDKARQLVNAYRAEHGLKPLALNTQLTNAAKLHSRDLAKWDRISHFGSDGTNPWDRIKRTGYNARLAAENVGTGQTSFDEALKGWRASPGHNKNLLLADAEHMGVALVYEQGTELKTFWTMVIGAPN